MWKTESKFMDEGYHLSKQTHYSQLLAGTLSSPTNQPKSPTNKYDACISSSQLGGKRAKKLRMETWRERKRIQTGKSLRTTNLLLVRNSQQRNKSHRIMTTSTGDKKHLKVRSSMDIGETPIPIVNSSPTKHPNIEYLSNKTSYIPTLRIKGEMKCIQLPYRTENRECNKRIRDIRGRTSSKENRISRYRNTDLMGSSSLDSRGFASWGGDHGQGAELRMKCLSRGRGDYSQLGIFASSNKLHEGNRNRGHWSHRTLIHEDNYNSSANNYVNPLYKGESHAKQKSNDFLLSFHEDWRRLLLKNTQQPKIEDQEPTLDREFKPLTREEKIENILNRPVNLVYPKAEEYCFTNIQQNYPIICPPQLTKGVDINPTQPRILAKDKIRVLKRYERKSDIINKKVVKNVLNIRMRVWKCIEHLLKLDLDPKEFMDNKIMSKRPYEKKCSKEFIYACKNGDIETVKKLLKYNKYLVYDFDQLGRTGLIWGIKRNNMRIIDLMLNNKADIDARDLQGRTALYLAAQVNNVELVTRLLGAGANPNIGNNNNVYPKTVTIDVTIKNYIIKAKKLLIVLLWTKGLKKRQKIWSNIKDDLFLAQGESDEEK